MEGKEKASLSRASMGRAWQPVGDALSDAEAEARRRRARDGQGRRRVRVDQHECGSGTRVLQTGRRRVVDNQ